MLTPVASLDRAIFRKGLFVTRILRNKFVGFTLLGALLVVLLVIIGGGWYFAGVLEADGLVVDNSPREFRLTVTAVGGGTISLEQIDQADPDDNLSESAVWGVTNGEDYGQLGKILSDSGELVTRELDLMVGDFQAGDSVYLERTAHPHDPRSAHGLDYQEVLIPGPLGNLPSWHVPPATAAPGASDVWAVLVHGRTSNRHTSLTILDNLAALGVHSLAINYRNDEGAPPSESGYYDFGVTEWEDVEAAVQYAIDNGAAKIILIGNSMGGGIVVNYQLKSELADRTVGMVLDSPMLNFGRTVDKGAEERGIPSTMVAAAKLIASLRYGVDWGAMDFLSHADELGVQILLIHGDEDATVPIETSLEFAERVPDLVDLHTFSEAGHVQVWNYYTDEYEAIVTNFVERVR